MKKVLVVFGTRPEAIKMCPLVKELKRDKDFEVAVCVSGQHMFDIKVTRQTLDMRGKYEEIDWKVMKYCIKNQRILIGEK